MHFDATTTTTTIASCSSTTRLLYYTLCTVCDVHSAVQCNVCVFVLSVNYRILCTCVFVCKCIKCTCTHTHFFFCAYNLQRRRVCVCVFCGAPASISKIDIASMCLWIDHHSHTVNVMQCDAISNHICIHNDDSVRSLQCEHCVDIDDADGPNERGAIIIYTTYTKKNHTPNIGPSV